MNWKGYVWDRVLKEYVNEGAPFEVTTQCTGYVVNPDGYIATAGHCVDPKGDVEDMLALQAAQWEMDQGLYDNTITAAELAEVLRVEGFETTNKGPDREVVAAWGVSAGGVQTGKSYNARVVKFQPFDQGDAAVIKVEATDLPAIQMADDSELEVGTEIVSVGYPASVDLVADQSFSPSFKDGSISSEKTLQGGQFTAYEISAAVSGGMSGGPTVDLDGEVVGFNSFKIDPSVESQQFNFVRSTSIINELMADVGVENELGEVSENYYAGLDAYFAGDKDAAVENLQAVIDDQPTNTMAADFLSKAKDMPEEEAASSDDGGGFPIALVGGIGVARAGPDRSRRVLHRAAWQGRPERPGWSEPGDAGRCCTWRQRWMGHASCGSCPADADVEQPDARRPGCSGDGAGSTGSAGGDAASGPAAGSAHLRPAAARSVARSGGTDGVGADQPARAAGGPAGAVRDGRLPALRRPGAGSAGRAAGPGAAGGARAGARVLRQLRHPGRRRAEVLRELRGDPLGPAGGLHNGPAGLRLLSPADPSPLLRIFRRGGRPGARTAGSFGARVRRSSGVVVARALVRPELSGRRPGSARGSSGVVVAPTLVRPELSGSAGPAPARESSDLVIAPTLVRPELSGVRRGFVRASSDLVIARALVRPDLSRGVRPGGGSCRAGGGRGAAR